MLLLSAVRTKPASGKPTRRFCQAGPVFVNVNRVRMSYADHSSLCLLHGSLLWINCVPVYRKVGNVFCSLLAIYYMLLLKA